MVIQSPSQAKAAASRELKAANVALGKKVKAVIRAVERRYRAELRLARIIDAERNEP